MAHVLIVDDRAANRDLLGYLLGYYGHRITQADSGASAVALAHADPPDLVVMDIAMPGVDGYDAARLMRLDPAMAGVPLVAVSASGSASAEAARAAGFDGFYRMPIDPQAFVSSLAPYLPTITST